MKKFRALLSIILLTAGGGGILSAQSLVTVSGVISESGADVPIAGAVVIAGNTGVAADFEGRYSITVAPGTTLEFQSIGFESAEYTVPSGQENITYDVQLKTDAQLLEETVVVAYGVRKKGTIAGSVSTVKSEIIEDVPAANFAQALQGKAPGLTVLSNSGEPSASPSFNIRGVNSINSGTAPLFILDGMQISASDFNAISPNDIESVSVLKDASSTSIYGARASNGVVVITTKRGTTGTATVTARMQLGFSQLAHGNWSMMNTAERIQYEKEVGLTGGQDYSKLALTDVDWLSEVFNDFAPLQTYELQVSGATEKVNYYISGSFFDQEGLTSDSDFQRYNIRANVEAQAKKWLKFGTNTMLAYEDFSESVAGEYAVNTPIAAARFMLPYWNPYRPDGSLASINDGSWKGTGENPLEWVENNPYNTGKYKVISAVFAEITPVKGLTIRSQFGADYTHVASKTFSYASYKPNKEQGKAARNSSDAMNLSITNTVNYKFDIDGLHDFNFMVGQEAIDYRSEGFSVSTSGQSNDLLYDVNFATRATNWSSSSTSYSYVSVFGRGEYNYAGRYYADFSVRGDGSSRFGKSGRWAPFWSVGLMWNLRNEEFARDASTWLTNAQIAFSTGTSGNSTIPDYEHLALVGGGKDYIGDSGIGPMSQGNEDLGWEKTFSTNLAFHLGFWNRLNVNAELYLKKTSDMLMSVPVSYATGGFGFVWDNVGGMKNQGVEVDIDADVIRTKDFSWNINANFSFNDNKITELYYGKDEYVMSTTGQKLVVGHSLGEFFLNEFAGVNPLNGDALWYDKDGNITNEYRESDKVMTGKSSFAPWAGGFGTTLSWKGLSLSAQFSWVADRYMVNNDRFFEEGGGNFDAYNQSKRMLYDRWKNPGDITDIPRHGVTPQMDTHLLEDASFLRLKNLQLSYSLPADLLAKTRFFTGARVYAQGQNLFTVTPFSGLDPESSYNVYKAQYPMSRQFSFGVELSF